MYNLKYKQLKNQRDVNFYSLVSTFFLFFMSSSCKSVSISEGTNLFIFFLNVLSSLQKAGDKLS